MRTDITTTLLVTVTLLLSACGGGGGGTPGGGDPIPPPIVTPGGDIMIDAYRGEPVSVDLSAAGITAIESISFPDEGLIAFLDYTVGTSTCTLTPSTGYVGGESFALTVTHDGSQVTPLTVSVGWARQSSSDITLVTGAGCTIDPGGPITSASGGDISNDGRYVVFQSTCLNLVDMSLNVGQYSQVLLYDRDSGTQTVISRAADGTIGDGNSSSPRISGDGRWIVYRTLADNITGISDTPAYQIALYDRITETTSIISQTSGGILGAEHSTNPSISDDGNIIVYCTAADNLIGEDNRIYNVAVVDRSGPTPVTTFPITNSGSGDHASISIQDARVSDDGQLITFTSQSSVLVANDTNSSDDLFVYDRGSDTTTRLSLDESDAQITGTYYYNVPSVSANGNRIVFSTNAPLVSSDTNGYIDVYVHDLGTGTNVLVSIATDGTVDVRTNSYTMLPVISGDGNLTYFQASDPLASGTNAAFGGYWLYEHNLQTSTTRAISYTLPSTPGAYPFVNILPLGVANTTGEVLQLGSHLLINPNYQSYFTSPQILDPSDDSLTTASIYSGRIPYPDGDLDYRPVISDDGRYVLFKSRSRNMMQTVDTSFSGEAILFDHQSGITTSVSPGIDGQPANGDIVEDLDMSGDARFICFTSTATNLVAGADTAVARVYRYDRQTDTMIVLFEPDGSTADTRLYYLQISDDGNTLVLSSPDPLVAADTNSYYDVYCYDLPSDSLNLVSRTSTGEAGNNVSYLAYLSADGETIAFQSSATNLDAASTSTKYQCYVYRRSTDTLTLISHTTDGSPFAYSCSINPPSPNGRFIPLVSQAIDVLATGGPTTINYGPYCYIYDLETDTYRLGALTDTGAIPDGGIVGASVSNDGQIVAFTSRADNLITGSAPPEGPGWWLYAHDLGTGNTAAVPFDNDRLSSGSHIWYPLLNANGTIITIRAVGQDFLPMAEPGYNAYTIPTPTGGGG